MGLVSVCLAPQVAVEIPNVRRVKMRRDSQYPTKRDHMICKCLTLSITYAATIGGLITITGTSTNLIFAEQFNTYVNAQRWRRPGGFWRPRPGDWLAPEAVSEV